MAAGKQYLQPSIYDILPVFPPDLAQPELTVRQSCAVESGARRSGRLVILLTTSTTLEVNSCITGESRDQLCRRNKKV